ncbi:hypothetical protein GCM10022402_07210 [Salinactinospora qingdaonensis]|uniref:Uncharacterized protein n=1 Tax=Salinactinospora qingdaonensis TaxID=702744 RepID=A0ABP7F0U2_9ACTN
MLTGSVHRVDRAYGAIQLDVQTVTAQLSVEAGEHGQCPSARNVVAVKVVATSGQGTAPRSWRVNSHLDPPQSPETPAE